MSQLERTVNTICVFCGSSMGNQPIYQAAAERLGQVLAQQGLGLVYGGGGVGLMGVVARTVLAGGGNVVGVLPTALMSKELPVAESLAQAHGELILVETMHERKATMARLSDAYIVLPGGYGTLDELFEALTWNQLGVQQKAIGLLNVAGYFDPLVAWVDRAITEGFIRPVHRDLFIVEAEPEALVTRLLTHTPPPGILKLESWRA
ncbi:MAG: TIGR00730 family Rossman fold protein [Caldilineaceae bacterium]